jgi:hypothetical protein
MTKRLTTILGTIALLALFTTTAMSEPPALAGGLSANAFAKEMTVRGRLQRTVEPGGWVIAERNQKYLILNARNFQNEKWFAEGNEVEAAGETKSDVMTTYMEGTPFEVGSMRALSTGSSITKLRRPVSQRYRSPAIRLFRLNRTLRS